MFACVTVYPSVYWSCCCHLQSQFLISRRLGCQWADLRLCTRQHRNTNYHCIHCHVCPLVKCLTHPPPSHPVSISLSSLNCLCVSLIHSLFVYLSFCLLVCFRLSVCLRVSVRLSIRLLAWISQPAFLFTYICIAVCLRVFLYLFVDQSVSRCGRGGGA